MPSINFKKLDERAVIPFKAHSTDVGYDITAIECEYDEEKDLYIYHTGLACETTHEDGKTNVCNLFPRSSNCKTDAYLTNSVGVVDSDGYRGEIQARFKNRTSLETMIQFEAHRRFSNDIRKCLTQYFTNGTREFPQSSYYYYDWARTDLLKRAKNLEFAPYKVGDKVGQLVLYSIPDYVVNEVEELDMQTERGEGGFGSSGQ